MKSTIFQYVILLFISSVSYAESISASSTFTSCEPGLHNQPNGPFAVMLFCESALGAHLGLIYKENMSIPVDGAWNLSDRFWQVSDWSTDVTAYVWEPSGKYLLISTSSIYGTGNVYRLDLKEREQTKIFDSDEYVSAKYGGVCSSEIISMDADKATVELELFYCDEVNKEIITVTY